MEFNGKEIKSNKTLNELDKFVINFINKIEKFTDYVIVSGYVAIILGRSRASEDVDLLIPKMEKLQFVKMFNFLLNNGYECANTSKAEEAYELLNYHAIRFYEKGFPLPNIEFKIISRELDEYSFQNKIKVVMKEKTLFISPLELQIPFKLALAAEGTRKELESDKDIEDARHLYINFYDKINKEELDIFLDKLNVRDKFRLLKWKPKMSR